MTSRQIRNLYAILLIIALALTATRRVLGQASNGFGTPVNVSSLPFTYQANGPNGPGFAYMCWNYMQFSNALWFQFTPAVAMNLQVNTAGSDYDTFIGAFMPEGNEVQCNDDNNGSPQALLRLTVMAGQTIYIGVNAEPGVDLHVAFEEIIPPVNDERSGAVSVHTLPFSYTGNYFGATWPGYPTPSCDSFWGSIQDVWFVYDADFTGNLMITQGAWNGAIATYKQEVDGTLSEIQCNGGSGNSLVGITQGARYYIRLFSQGAGFAEDVTTTFKVAPPPLELKLQYLEGTVSPSTGQANISGTVTCSKPAWVRVNAETLQPLGKSSISGWSAFEGSCTPDAPMTGRDKVWYYWQPHNGRSTAYFRGGKVTVHAWIISFDDELGTYIENQVQGTVQLKATPAPR
jgi:hypothetical protein